MTLEEEYRKNLEVLTEAYIACVEVMNDEESNPDEVLAFSEALRAANARFQNFKATAVGDDSVPNMGMFLNEQGKFNSFVFHVVQTVGASGTIPKSEQLRTEELIFVSKIIKEYMDKKRRENDE